MTNSLDYPAIQIWGNKLGSYQYYIDAQIKLAREEKAPANAIYRVEEGKWATVDHINDIDNRPDMAALLQYKGEK